MCLPLLALAPIIGGAVAAAGSVTGAVVGANAAHGAAKQQEDAATKALEVQKQVAAQQQANFAQQQANIQPWLDTGRQSLAQLASNMGAGLYDKQIDPSQIANDPGYQFRMAEGQKALERSASARGMLNSGGALKSLTRYSQGVASDEYQNAWNRNQAQNTNSFNRMASMAGVGQAAGQTLGALNAQNSAQMNQGALQMGNLYGAIGNAQAAGTIGVGNAINGAAQSLGNLGMMYGMGAFGGGGQNIPTQYGYSGQPPAYGQSTLGYQTQGYGPWR